MSYTVNFSDPSKDPIVLDSMEKDTTSTSITLHGRGAKNYGEDQQENFLHLLENFASPTEPLHPVEGQLWYDTSNATKILKLCVSNVGGNAVWVSIQSTQTTTTAPTNPVAGQQWYDVVNQIQYVYTGTSWQPITNNIVDPSLQYLAIVFS